MSIGVYVTVVFIPAEKFPSHLHNDNMGKKKAGNWCITDRESGLSRYRIRMKEYQPFTCYFFRENINIYLHFMSFLHANKTQVVEIPPRVRQGPAYST